MIHLVCMQPTNPLEALRWRYTVKTFDPTRKVSQEHIDIILEAGRLAPSSYGLEPWTFIVITNSEIRARLRKAGFNQTKITDASHLIVVAVRTDIIEHGAEDLMNRTAKQEGVTIQSLKEYRAMVDDGIASHVNEGDIFYWLMAQTYIPLAFMMQTASLLGIDSGPMEGFDSEEVDRILQLEHQSLHSVTMLAIGYRGDDPVASRQKVRRPAHDAITYID